MNKGKGGRGKKETQTKFPCQLCGKSAKWGQKALQCDSCDMWYHVHGLFMNSIIYDALANSSTEWNCCNCGLPSIASSFFSSIASNSMGNVWSDANSSTSSLHSPIATLSPIHEIRGRCQRTRKKGLNILVANCTGVTSKREQLAAELDYLNPDVFIITETKLGPGTNTSEILPMNYKAHRRDRKAGGGGVMIAVRDDISFTPISQYDTNCELTWIELHLQGAKSLSWEHTTDLQNRQYSHWRNWTKQSVTSRRTIPMRSSCWVVTSTYETYPGMSWRT